MSFSFLHHYNWGRNFALLLNNSQSYSFFPLNRSTMKLDNVFKNGLSKICGRQPSKNFTWSIIEYLVPCVEIETDFVCHVK